MSGHPTEFGKRVKALRLTAGLTQAELAESSGISERTVSDLERGQRATVYPATARQLAGALDVGDDDLATFLLAAGGRGERGATANQFPSFPSAYRSRLPYRLTRLIGRETELATVLGLMRDSESRLITLVGTGGVGKTRVATEAAAITQEEFISGSHFVTLSAIDDPGLVLAVVATSVGVQPGAGELVPMLARRLGAGPALLVLDTFEHVVAAAPDIGELVSSCPSLTVLVTSRTALHLRGEREVPLRPLAVWKDEFHDETFGPAMALFMERAHAVAPNFPVTPAVIDSVSDICARLDGLPLAIELAAARVKHMPLSELLAHLDHRLDPLVGGARDLPPRHQTMRAAIDWSYVLLGPTEMRLLRSLSVFRGTFGRHAAETVAASIDKSDSPGALATLSALVDASLVAMETGVGGRARYRLLDVVREYAAERAVSAGELEQLRRRHAEYFLELAERSEPELRGSQQREWYGRLLEDEGNFRAALSWALEGGESEIALRLAGALWMFWRWAGLFVEGRAGLDAALAGGEECAVGLRCQGLWGAGWLAYHQGDYQRTAKVGQQMLGLLNGADNILHRRNALTLVGIAALAEGRGEDAVAALRDALDVCEELGKSWHLGTSLLNLGTAQLYEGRGAQAKILFERALAIYEDLADRHFSARTLVQLGYTELALGQREKAATHIRSAMSMSVDLGDAWSIAEGLEAVATLLSESAPRSAAILTGSAERLRDEISMRPHPADAIINDAYLRLAQEQLTREIFEDARREGREMTWESVIVAALEEAEAGGAT
ncbi:MAG: tetratricopeptide repeat protein [Actinobacteria bacterium]|nr:tetratricopeptide repeat protein [Actinomycetota bacterium]MDQ3532837.1 tetratricopeptide repeat protein [Actinomycetota bacterium]